MCLYCMCVRTHKHHHTSIPAPLQSPSDLCESSRDRADTQRIIPLLCMHVCLWVLIYLHLCKCLHICQMDSLPSSKGISTQRQRQGEGHTQHRTNDTWMEKQNSSTELETKIRQDRQQDKGVSIASREAHGSTDRTGNGRG